MSIVCTTPYRAPIQKPEVGVFNMPRWGVGVITDYNDYSQMFTVFGSREHNIEESNTLQFPDAGWDDFFYYISPIEYGNVSFRNSFGMTGGWDGATWPIDDMASTNGPVEVFYQGQSWLLYRTDWPGNWAETFVIGFENI